MPLTKRFQSVSFLLSLLVAGSAFAADAKNFTITPWDFRTINNNGSQGVVTLLFDATTDALEFIFPAETTSAITQLCVHYAYQNSGNPPAHTLSLQGVNLSTGRADGSTKSSGNATCNYDPPGNSSADGTIQCCTMTSSYTPAALGELLALNLTCASGCAGGASGAYAVTVTNNNNSVQGFPFAWSINGGSASRQGLRPIFGYKTASQTFGFLRSSDETATFTSASTPDEKGMSFVLPTNLCSTAVLRSANLLMTLPAATTSCDVVLYDGTTALQTFTIDGEVTATGASTSNERRMVEAVFPASTLTCGNTYRVALKPGASANCALFRMGFGSNGNLASLGGAGTWYYTSRTDAGAWSDDTTYMPGISLTFGDLTAPSGSVKINSLNPGLN